MGATTIVITGTDTGVGKTVLTALLIRHARQKGVHAAAFKPIASGDRADASWLAKAQNGNPDLNRINPWHFPAPISPLLAARRQHRRVSLSSVLNFLREAGRGLDVLLIEGAGGLLSPLGEGFDTRTLIARLKTGVVVVCPNRLGSVGQARLVLAALPPASAKKAIIVLVQSPVCDAASKSNATLLAEYIGRDRILDFPWLSSSQLQFHDPLPSSARTTLEALCQHFLP